MKLSEIKQKLAPIEELARPVNSNYVRNAVEGKLDILYKLSKEVPSGGTIVEIGSLFGSTAILMGFATKPSVKIHCVELNVLSKFIDHIKEHKMEGKIAIWAGSSQSVRTRWQTPIDLLYIDGDHTYESVLRDSEMWTPYIEKGGIVVWHDYNNNSLECKNVKKAVDEFLERSSNFEVIIPETANKFIRVARKKT